ncbi:MAG: formate C-acetyltransferase/glycerol dehydratase family glycyl radical enzyme [Lachnospiraceae bacterium]|nr:formate C-acetyltransferase/glycerol dehydratase family glycyl radical enzyme [Lachnospiraceae bacterium]
MKAIGVEPYDKNYGLGYESGHKEYSPYPRVNRLRERFLKREFNIDIERARLVTESYRANEDAPVKLKCARALANVLDNVELHIYDDELIIGDIAAPAKAAPVYPEFSASWIEDELLNHPFDKREHDRFYITDKDREELLQILKYWRGKTVSDMAEEAMSDEEKAGNELGKKVYMTSLYHYGGIGHFVMDYALLMKEGFGGLLKKAKEAYAEKKAGTEDFYEAVITEIEAAERYIKRYAALAREKAGECSDGKRREELLAIGDNCEHISEQGAENFWQALQLWHFATTIVQIESNGHSVSYGRMDQWLYPFYEKDIREGKITKEFAEELLECAYVRMGNPSKLKDRVTTSVRNGRGWGGESLTIGGVGRDGHDATNDLTFMMLEASVHTRMMNPWVCLRVHEDTPEELMIKAAECIRAGYGHPKLYNDHTAIKVMMKKGVSLEDARDYAVVGCVEPDMCGMEFGLHDAAYINLVKVMDLALNNGRCTDCSSSCPRYKGCAGQGKRLGTDAGSILDHRDIEDSLSAFKKELKYWLSLTKKSLDAIEKAHRTLKPTPFASAFFADCLEKGRDLTEGGARYNYTGPQGCGIATCADSLSAINQLVFEEKSFSAEDILNALKSNYEDNPYLYALVNSTKVHHFGNDDDLADRFYTEVFNIYCDAVEELENPRGGKFTPGVYSVNANVGMGMNTPASADGRKSGEPISDNMGPVHTAVSSHDVNGPTAISNSVNKADHSRATNGTLLNWKFTPDCVAGDRGRDNLVSFITTYFKGSATHCQFNIMSSEMMRAAMKDPDSYRDMLVRVAGYSAYFVELGEPLQMDLINRTELKF